MSDTTSGLMQKLSARQVDGEHLQVLGKKAAALWAGGQAKNMNEAVNAVVKTAGLLPEQVKRVVEFANTDAYLGEFRKEGAPHHVVDFGAGGPASYGVVLQDLNQRGSITLSNGDYNLPPEQTKTASAWEETALEQMFGGSGVEYPEVNPLGDVITLRDKLGSSYTQCTAVLSNLETVYDDLKTALFGHVKQAALSGHSLSEIAQIWSGIAPSDEHVKVAFSSLTDQLLENGVFQTAEALVESFEKHAAVGMINEAHPLLTDFKEFCEVLTKLAEVRADQQELGEGHAQLTSFLKQAERKGLLDAAGNALERASEHAGRGGEWVGEKLLGPGSGAKHLGTAARLGTKYVLPAVAANEAYRHTLKHNPTFQAAKGGMLGVIPGTQEYQNKELELQMRAQGYPMGGGYQ